MDTAAAFGLGLWVGAVGMGLLGVFGLAALSALDQWDKQRRRREARTVFTARDPEAEMYETEQDREIHETFGPLVEAQLRTIPKR